MKLFTDLQLATSKASQHIAKRSREIIKEKSAMTFIEIVVLISVILVIATALFLLRGEIVKLISGGTTYIGNFQLS